MSRQPAVYYHYTSHEGLAGILDAKMILPSLPHPATPGILAGESIVSSVGAVFLTRMDPTNSKESIAFNNYRYVHRVKSQSADDVSQWRMVKQSGKS